MSASFLRKLGAVAAGLVVAAIVPAAASAAPARPQLNFDKVTLTPDHDPDHPAGDSKMQNIYLWTENQSFTLHDVTAVIDVSRLPAGVTAKLEYPGIDDHCKAAGTTFTCTFDTLPSYETVASVTTLSYSATKDAAFGAQGTAGIKVTSREFGTITRSAEVLVAEGVDLAVDDNILELPAKPGATVAVPLGVRNNGANAITGVDLSFFMNPWYSMAKHYSNCRYGTTAAYCHFDTSLKPHTAYTLSETMGVKIRSDIPAPVTVGQSFDWLTPNDNSDYIDLVNKQKPKRGTDGALTLKAKPAALARSFPQTDISLGVDWQDALFEVKGIQVGDVAAVGAQVRGATGGTVTATVGVKNLGPAFEFGYPDPAAKVTVTAPAGTTVVSVPEGCAKAGAAYVCTTTVSPLNVNASVVWPFKLRIDRAGTLTGSVVVKSSGADGSKANDRAELVVNPPAGAGGTGDQAASGGGGGGLAITGAPAALVGGGGLLLLGGGAAAYVISRRRKARFIA